MPPVMMPPEDFADSTYNVRLAGAGCGFAFNSGRIAGENASNYIKET